MDGMDGMTRRFWNLWVCCGIGGFVCVLAAVTLPHMPLPGYVQLKAALIVGVPAVVVVVALVLPRPLFWPAEKGREGEGEKGNRHREYVFASEASAPRRRRKVVE